MNWRELRSLMLANGFVAGLMVHAMFFWRYWRIGEWWRTEVPWTMEDVLRWLGAGS